MSVAAAQTDAMDFFGIHLGDSLPQTLILIGILLLLAAILHGLDLLFRPRKPLSAEKPGGGSFAAKKFCRRKACSPGS